MTAAAFWQWHMNPQVPSRLLKTKQTRVQPKSYTAWPSTSYIKYYSWRAADFEMSLERRSFHCFLLLCFVFSFCFLSEGPPYWSNCLFTSCDFLFRSHLDCLATKCFAAVCTPLLIFSLHCWWNWLFASLALILHNCCKSEMLHYQDSAGC